MRSVKAIILFLGVMLGSSVWSQAPPAKQSPATNNSPYFFNGDAYVVAEGMLRADNLNERTELAFDTVTRIECYKRGGSYLVDSEAYCMTAAASVGLGGMPAVDVQYMPVKSWGREVVIAADSPSAQFPICTWSQFTINLREKSVMVTDIKKTGAGHEGMNGVCKQLPLSETYHLVNTSEESIRRSTRAAHPKSTK